MQAYQLDQKLERKTFASVGCSEAENKEVCTITGVTKGKEKTKGHHTAENSCYYTMAKEQKKSFVCNFKPNVLCLVILLFYQSYLVSSRLPNYQYHVDSLVDTRKGVAVLFRRNGRWVLDTGVHRVRYENATIFVVEVSFLIIILSFEVLPFYHITVIFCKVQKCMLNVCMLTETYPLM